MSKSNKQILSQLQIKAIIKIALEAGKIAMSYFGSKNLYVNKKNDDSPLTIADSLISQLIFFGLQKITPNIPVICEEGKNRDFGNGIFWLIDPIDGTSSFVANNQEFTINIALIKNRKPIFGLIFAPATIEQKFYYTNSKGMLMQYFVENKKEKIVVTKKKVGKDLVIITSKRSSDQSILDSFSSLTNNNNNLNSICKQKTRTTIITKVSSSLKFLYLIEGKADLYLHLRRSMEWDVAAGQALIEALGGKIINLDSSNFLYQKADLANKPFMVII
jgi:3'(2'), 5'-bisphosphate nucleotidase